MWTVVDEGYVQAKPIFRGISGKMGLLKGPSVRTSVTVTLCVGEGKVSSGGGWVETALRPLLLLLLHLLLLLLPQMTP